MSMKRTIPGRIDSVFSQSNDGKEIIATKIISDEEAEAEVAETTEEEVTAEADNVEK